MTARNVSRLMFAAALASTSLCASANLPAQRSETPAGESLQTVYWDTLDANGALTGGNTKLMLPTGKRPTSVLPAFSTTLTQSLLPPNPANRLDLVFVGDGYTSSQLAAYASNVTNVTNSMFNIDPYATYKNYFLVHRVDVVSPESGVDNDPQGVFKNTALDMTYWCSGIDRLLCVDVNKAYQYANNAPDVDLVAALANSSTYGGAGYPSNDLATSAGSNGSAIEIIKHEFGHALGDLADEYDYGGPSTYTGGEPGAPDLSKLTAAEMAMAGTKWASWLNVNNASFDGLQSTFEGGGYSQFGIYRPSNNSLMRSLGRPFNLPSAQAVVIQIYRIVKPIDDSSDPSVLYNGTETLFVTPMVPIGHALDIQWSKNGVPIAGATGTTLDLSSLGIGNCPTSVSVQVVDNTFMVRDAALRAQWLTETRSFTVQSGGPTISNYCSTSPNSVGPGAVMYSSGSSSVAANDLTLIAIGCPPNTTGLFFYGQTETFVPFGNGNRCVANPFWRLPAQQADFLGDLTRALNLNALPSGGQISAGQTWKFQAWYRNPAGGGAGFNTSDGLSVRFCP